MLPIFAKMLPKIVFFLVVYDYLLFNRGGFWKLENKNRGEIRFLSLNPCICAKFVVTSTASPKGPLRIYVRTIVQTPIFSRKNTIMQAFLIFLRLNLAYLNNL